MEFPDTHITLGIPDIDEPELANDDNSSDEDYIPSEHEETESEDTDDYEKTESESSEEEEEEEEEEEPQPKWQKNMPFFIITSGAHPHGRFAVPSKKPSSSTHSHITQSFSKIDEVYWESIDEPQRAVYSNALTAIKNPTQIASKVPLRFKILASDISTSAKELILNKLDHFQTMPDHTGEYYKMRNWLSALDNMPLGHYKPLPVSTSDPKDKIVDFLQHVRKTLDDTVYGHNEAKDQILRILAQWISNPNAKGHCIGICGSMGVGKTSIIKDGLSKALGLPFSFITLGGASDGALLEGHNYTYEGSSYGKICEVLMKAKCMNPIMFFDELDKVSNTSRGDEVSSILTHLTDSTQNDHFTDRYFGEIDINLSKALMIFSYNDEALINPILKDRMITIRVPGYNLKDKLIIAKDYLIPKILAQYNFATGDIVFSDEILENIIGKLPTEEGVRGLKRGIESIVSWLNMYKYIPPKESPDDSKKRRRIYENIVFPLNITSDHVDHLLSKSELDMKKRSNDIISTMYL